MDQLITAVVWEGNLYRDHKHTTEWTNSSDYFAHHGTGYHITIAEKENLFKYLREKIEAKIMIILILWKNVANLNNKKKRGNSLCEISLMGIPFMGLNPVLHTWLIEWLAGDPEVL